MGVQIGGSQRECRGEDAGWADPGGRERRPFPHAAVKPDCSNAFCGVKASLAKKLVSNPVGDEGVWAAAAARRGRRGAWGADSPPPFLVPVTERQSSDLVVGADNRFLPSLPRSTHTFTS